VYGLRHFMCVWYIRLRYEMRFGSEASWSRPFVCVCQTTLVYGLMHFVFVWFTTLVYGIRPWIWGLLAEAICLCLLDWTSVWIEALCLCYIYYTSVWNKASDPSPLGRGHLFVFVRVDWCMDWGTLFCVWYTRLVYGMRPRIRGHLFVFVRLD
jgi:hypothetical protein